MKKTIILLIIAVFLASCATNSGPRNTTKNIKVSKAAKLTLADNSSDEKVICKQVKKTGSHRITTICRSQSEIESRRDSTQRELQKRIGNSGEGPPGH